MTKYCNPQQFEVKKYCPDCKRKIDPITEGKVKCKKCLQYVIFKNGEPIKAIPKELI